MPDLAPLRIGRHACAIYSPHVMKAPQTQSRSSVPLFAQVRDALREHILSGGLSTGGKLPSEGELEATYQVSRITVRQALAGLHASGLIEKVNGKGSFVKRPDPPRGLGPLTGFYETMRRRGHTALGKVSAIRHIQANPQVAANLKISIGLPVSAVTIMRMVDGEPYARHIAYASAGLIERLVLEDLETNDLITIAQERLGYRLDHSDMDISADIANARIAKSLGITPGAPVLRLCITSVDARGEPLIFSEFLGRGDRFHYQLTAKR
jgi:GntR family transcriptional regulator